MQLLKGQVWKVGNDIDTDLIIAARYLNSSDSAHLAAHCLEDLRPELVKLVKQGDVLVAGRNFGCGSSREHAPIALKHAGFSCVVAESYARIFYRNAINIGLPIIIAPEAARAAKEGDIMEVDPGDGTIRNLTANEQYKGEPFPPFIQEILACGGLIPYTMGKVKKRA